MRRFAGLCLALCACQEPELYVAPGGANAETIARSRGVDSTELSGSYWLFDAIYTEVEMPGTGSISLKLDRVGADIVNGQVVVVRLHEESDVADPATAYAACTQVVSWIRPHGFAPGPSFPKSAEDLAERYPSNETLRWPLVGPADHPLAALVECGWYIWRDKKRTAAVLVLAAKNWTSQP